MEFIFRHYPKMANEKIKTVLAGNPNCGKSTVFNQLTGAKQTIGNFPGVTVERYEGRATFGNREIEIIDLPGLYSLNIASDEERVAVEYILHEPFDLIVNIVDASNLERNLYLTLLLKELHKPMFVVLNMVDVAKRRGIQIDTEQLSETLGVPILETIGSRGVGIDAVLKKIVSMGEEVQSRREKEGNEGSPDTETDSAPISASTSSTWEKVSDSDESSACSTGKKSKKEGGHCGCGHCGNCPIGQASRQMEIDIARYQEINRIGTRCVRSTIPLDRRFSDKVDAVLTHHYFGIPIFFVAMYLVFQLTFTLGQYPMDWMEAGIAWLKEAIGGLWAPGSESFLKSLLLDGIIGGVGGVLVFLPNILILFLAISLLEDSGYMARAALLSDRWLHKIGLPGKSIVPLLIGFGCSIPAMMATRMITDRKERFTTLFVVPLFSCGARFPIYALLIPAFFPVAWRGPILWLIYLIGIALAVTLAKLMSVFFMKGEEAPFIIELPAYHFPTFRTVGLRTIERGWQYLKKAGTIILGISIVLWFLTSYPGLSSDRKAKFDEMRAAAMASFSESVPSEIGESSPAPAESSPSKGGLEEELTRIDHEELQAKLTESFAGRLGRLMTPILRPMGFDWKIGTALIGAIAAKEVFVAQMGLVYSIGDVEESDDGEDNGLAEILAENYSPLVGFCVMLFCLIATPCMATFVMMAKETGSWKWAFCQWSFLTVIAWILTTATYQIGSLFL